MAGGDLGAVRACLARRAPSSFGGPDPTLTSQALATRTAEKIFQRYFGGGPWVGREAPIPSISDAVTQAVIARGL